MFKSTLQLIGITVTMVMMAIITFDSIEHERCVNLARSQLALRNKISKAMFQDCKDSEDEEACIMWIAQNHLDRTEEDKQTLMDQGCVQ